MILKWIFDRIVAFFGLLFLWPVLMIVAIMVKIKMPGGPAFFVQKRVGKDGKLFNCHKFRTMTINHNGSTVSVAGDSRITPFEQRCVTINWMNCLVCGMYLSETCPLSVPVRMYPAMRTNSKVMTVMYLNFAPE